MADELTPKQEAFCNKFIELDNASEAYRQSYDAENCSNPVIWNEASLLLANREVSIRIGELRQRIVERNEVTQDSLVKEYEEARQIGIEINNPTSMVSATTGKAKVCGMIVDKVDAKIDVNAVIIDRLTRARDRAEQR